METKKVRGSAGSAEIKQAIAAAMERLNLEPVKANFAILAAEVGLSKSTLYGAFRGDHGLGPAPLRSLRRIVEERPDRDYGASESSSFGSDPRAMLKHRREELGISRQEMAVRIRFKAVYIADVEEARVRPTELFLKKAATVLGLPLEALKAGSDQPEVIDETGRHGTFGSVPNFVPPAGKTARYVPKLSWAQGGALDAGHVDDAYDYTGVIAIDINDRKAFGLTIRGDSMSPQINEGDDAIVCPSWPARNGDTVIVKTMEGDVMCKLYQSKEGGSRVILSSYNPAFPPIELSRQEIRWVHPIGQVIKNLRRE